MTTLKQTIVLSGDGPPAAATWCKYFYEISIIVFYNHFQDGHIDFREFMIVLYIMSNGTPEENLKQIFRVFDINNDGTITLKVSHKMMIFSAASHLF